MTKRTTSFLIALLMLATCFTFTSAAEETQTFKIVSAAIDTDKFAVTFNFSQEVHIFNQSHVWFCTRPSPKGEFMDNEEVIGHDQYGVKSIEYVNPTVVSNVEYSKTVIITFNKPATPEDFMFSKGLPATAAQAGVRIVEYSYSSDFNNGTVASNVIRTVDGKVLGGNFVAGGGVDICWVPTEAWYDVMESVSDWNYLIDNYTYDVTMSVTKPEVSVINTIDAENGKLEFTFTQSLKLKEGYQIDLGGIKSVSVTPVGEDEYNNSFIVDFGTDVSDKTEYSIPEEMFENFSKVTLGVTKEGETSDYPLPSFDDISDKFETGEQYSFMNTDTGRMLTVDGKTEFKLEYFESANKYALSDENGKYVNLQTMQVQDAKYGFDIVLNNEYERYQIVAFNGSMVLLDDDTGDTNAAAIAYAAYGTNFIETGWYMTKKGDELPKKFVCIGDSITCGVTPEAVTVKPGYRKELSEMLLEEYGRVVFVGNLKHVRGGNTTSIDNTLVTDGFLYRHEGHSGWVIEGGHYPEAAAPDNNRGIADLREGLQTKYAPDVFFMMIGINDIGGMSALGGGEDKINIIADRWETLVRAILSDLPDDGILFGATLTPRSNGSAWLTTGNIGLEMLNEKYTAIIEEINAEGEERLVKADNYTYVKNAGPTAVSTDTVHLMSSGFTALANSYFDAYKASYKEPLPAGSGDINGDGEKNADDAIYLLYNVFFGDTSYPITEDPDVNADGRKNANDAIYLLYNIFFGEAKYPLYPENDNDSEQGGGEDIGGGGQGGGEDVGGGGQGGGEDDEYTNNY